jgi:hypothetical protein
VVATCNPIYCQDGTDCTQVGGSCDTSTELCTAGSEDRDPINGALDNNWSTDGGCGWQTKTVGDATGGIWHTGTIDVTTVSTCAIQGGASSQCQLYETIGTTLSSDKAQWFELLKTPVMHKVNLAEDAEGNPAWNTQHLWWAWNVSLDLRDIQSAMTWELDLDTESIVASNLDRFPVYRFLNGPHGAAVGGNAPLTDGFHLFASTHVCAGDTSVICREDKDCEDLSLTTTCVANLCGNSGTACDTDLDCYCVQNPNTVLPCVGQGCSINGTSGTLAGFCQWTGTACTDNTDCGAGEACIIPGDRVGKNSCFFEGDGATQLPFRLAAPWDDDQGTDDYVYPAGPRRNFDITLDNGPDMRFGTLEDVYGDSGSTFQGSSGRSFSRARTRPRARRAAVSAVAVPRSRSTPATSTRAASPSA